MTKAQARRLSLWANGLYLMGADHTGFDDGTLDDEEGAKVMTAQAAIAADMIARSGLPIDLTQREALEWVHANRRT